MDKGTTTRRDGNQHCDGEAVTAMLSVTGNPHGCGWEQWVQIHEWKEHYYRLVGCTCGTHVFKNIYCQ